MKISSSDWLKYIRKLASINDRAASLMQSWMVKNGLGDVEAMIAYAQSLATRYGEAAASLACEMYDAVAAAQNAAVPPAEPAPTATYQETARAVRGTLKNQRTTVPGTVGRLVKQAGADTTLKNAARDGAQFAWVPHGDTCAFCLTLASNGWRYMSKDALRNGHAEHIHPHCDCTYAIRFGENGGVEGYDPDAYLEVYENAEGATPQEKINAIRRDQYAADPEKYRAQKRAAYAAQKAGLPTSGAAFVHRAEQILQRARKEYGDELVAVVKPTVFTNAEGNSIIMTSAQKGKKFGKHCKDFGLDPSKKEDRDRLEAHIQDILRNKTAKYPGTFSGQGGIDLATGKSKRGSVVFYEKDNDVVIVSADETQFISILKDGVTGNKNVRRARSAFFGTKGK